MVESRRDDPRREDADPGVDRAALRAPAVPLEPFPVAYRGRRPFRSAHKPPLSRRFVPLVESLHGYDRTRLRTDAVAGFTVAALALPASMAYADIAGLPVTSGLYSLLLPLVVYAVLGSVPWLVVGPESTLALLVAAGLGPLAIAGSAEYTSLAAALALLVGGVYLAARLLRLGWIADYFSQAVLVGYITGVAALILLGQVGKLVGVSSEQDNKVVALVDTAANLGRANGPTVALATISLLLLVGLRHFVPRFPAALLVVVLGIGSTWALDLAEHGVSTAGEVPSGLPDLVVPGIGGADFLALAAVAVGIFLVGFSDSILTARSFAAQRGERVDADQELLAFSAANAAAGVTQGMPMGTTGSRTAVNLSMGATSQVTGLVASGSILVVLLLLTEPIQYLPDATLAAIIVTGAVRLLDPDQWRSLARSSRAELAIAALTVLTVVNVGVLEALVAAVVLSLLDVVRRVARPNDAVLGWSTTERHYADVDHDATAAVTPGVVIYRFSDRLFFANVHFFKRRVWAAVDAAPGPTRHVVLDMAGVPGMDASAATGLRELQDGLSARNVSLEIAKATDPLHATMDRLGLVELIGAEHFHTTVTAAVEAVARRPAGA
jgi:high affinity sulfate transporter 1